MDEHTKQYFEEVTEIAKTIDTDLISILAKDLTKVKRVFVLGVGGSAGNASHMVNDLRKLCFIEAYAPTDNVSELTARTNDEGFETVFQKYLEISRFTKDDAIFVLSVGGGNIEKNVSTNLIKAINYVKILNGKIFGIVGKKDGYLVEQADIAIVIPNVNNDRVTPHSEAFQSVVWHCLVSNPILQKNKTKW